MSNYGSSADSGWKPGKNKSILTPKNKPGDGNSPKRKAAASFARSAGSTRSSGYGQDVQTSKAAPKAKEPRKPVSKATAASFVGKNYGGGGTSTPPAAQRAAKRAVTTKSAGDRYAEGLAKRSEKRKDRTIQQRIQMRAFKGKFYGPDEFKGDTAAIKKWKAGGKKRNSDGSPKV